MQIIDRKMDGTIETLDIIGDKLVRRTWAREDDVFVPANEIELVVCPACKGSGTDKFTEKDCPECAGYGFVPSRIQSK